MIKFRFRSPKVNPEVLTDFAQTADFGKKGGQAERVSEKSEEKPKSATGVNAENVFPHWVRNSKK